MNNKGKRQAVFREILFPLLVGFIAIGASYLLLYYGEKYFDSQTEPVAITLNEDGTLSVSLEGERDNIYILWETDGGSVTPTEENPDFSHLKDENNRNYICYTFCDDKIIWNNKDASGEEFETATVRAIIYYVTEDQKKDYVGSEGVETELTITLHMEEDGTVTQSEDRYFSNPVKKGSTDTWSEIYVVKEDEKSVTLRYRTSEDVGTDENEILVLCWENEEGIISQTDLAAGLFPDVTVSEETNHQTQIKQSDLITFYKSDVNKETEISAFLVDSSIYENDSFSEEEKLGNAMYRYAGE